MIHGNVGKSVLFSVNLNNQCVASHLLNNRCMQLNVITALKRYKKPLGIFIMVMEFKGRAKWNNHGSRGQGIGAF